MQSSKNRYYQKWAKQALKKESANGEAPVAPEPPPVVVAPEPPLVDAAPAATVSEGKTGGGNLQGGKDNFYVAWVFALELKLSKTLSGLVYFVLQL